MVKVLIADKMDALAEKIFKSRDIEVDIKPGLTPDELKAAIPNYDGVAVRSSAKINAQCLENPGRLKVIGRAGIGVDTIDVKAATAAGVVVMNTPFGNSITTAEHALAMMMALARQIPQANASTHAGRWEKSGFLGVELYGKTIGIIGCGNIGSIVASRARGLEMTVIAFDPFLTNERALEIGVEKVDLDTLFARADFITLHTPLTDQTRNIIDAAALKKCKKGVRIVNCARGGLIVEKDLKEALDSGQVAGAALDVFEVEPAKDNILFNNPNVICTPHLGASTSEAQVNVAIQVAEQMSDFLLAGSISNAVNMPSISAEDAPRLKPYMGLATQLGSFLGQITTISIDRLDIEYQGKVSKLNIRPLTACILSALLGVNSDSVNMVNAPEIAKARKMAVAEIKIDECDLQTAIKLIAHTKNGTTSLTGTLFANAQGRIINIDGVPIEAALTPNILFIRNDDKPGMIGGLGTLLGQAKINIADFRLGRVAEGGVAVSLVSIDQPIPDDVFEKISALGQINTVKRLSF